MYREVHRPLRPAIAGIASGLVTLAFGFGALCVFWFTGDHDPSLTGLFEYRSATVGDGLLLPVLVGVLAAAATALRSAVAPRRRMLASLGGLLGGLLGVLVIWRWLEDPDPRLNWTWPAPHDFNCAGWVHAVFLCVAAAVVGALLVYVLVSLRARRKEDGGSFGAWAFGAWAAVGLLALILRDNQQASGTEAALATSMAIVFAALLVVALAFWAEGRRIVSSILVGVLGAAGTLAYCYYWPPPHPGLVAPLWIPVVALAFALTQPLSAASEAAFKGRAALLLASAVGAAGALAVGVHEVVDGHLWSVLASGCAAAAALLVPVIAMAPDKLRSELREDLLGTLGVVCFVIAALLSAAWLAFGEFDKQHALATLGAVELTFDILVFTLFRNRFRDLVDSEAKLARDNRPPLSREDAEFWRKHGRLPEQKRGSTEEEARNEKVRFGAVPDLYLSLYVFAAAALSAVVILLAAAADPIGINDVVVGNNPESEVLLLLGAVFLGVLVLGGLSAMWAAREASLPAHHAQGRRLGAGVLLGGLASAAVLALTTLLGGSINQPGLAAAAALVYTLLVVESLVFSPMRLQLERVDLSRALLVGVTGVAVFAASFWLFAVGVWSDGGPASVWRIGAASTLVLGSCFVLAASTGIALAKAGSGRAMTPSDPDVNVTLDQFLYALFMFLIGVFPVAAAAQIDAASGDSFGLVSSLMFLPGVFGAFIWVVDNNSTHHRVEGELADPRPAMWEQAGWDSVAARKLLVEYREAMHLHGKLQNRGAVAALVAALVFVAAKLMGA